MSDTRIEIGDIVQHGPTDEEWLVCFADYETGDMAWMGWPDGRAKISDCTLVRKATPEERAYWLAACLNHGSLGQSRFRRAIEMYGNTEVSQ